MTNKTLRDYINLIENAQRAALAEGTKENNPKKPMTWQQAYAHNDGESFDARQKRITQYEKSKGKKKPKHVDWDKKGGMQEGLEQGMAEATGNPGMPRPYDQGREDAKKGRPYDNPYDQPGEEHEHNEYKKGYRHGKQQDVAEDQLEETSPDAIEKIEQLVRK